VCVPRRRVKREDIQTSEERYMCPLYTKRRNEEEEKRRESIRGWKPDITVYGYMFTLFGYASIYIL
jgi:hypothetical protein